MAESGPAGSEIKATPVALRLPTRLGSEKAAMSAAAALATEMGFPGERIEDLKTAVAEACINAIEHGNRGNEKLFVEVVLQATGDVLEVKVIDEGAGVRKLPSKPEMGRKMRGEEEPRGMGIFLIQALVDEAEWVAAAEAKKSYIRLLIRLDKAT
jgi:serine/threonine-protein kinase RsbW